MTPPYDHQAIEPKWQQYWSEHRTFRASDSSEKPKHYILDMFPYPSGAGLHVGHPLGYTATDIISRKRRHEGYEVLHPMGWDAFGLPAENYAIKTKVHPEKSTLQNIETFKGQLQSLGFSFDWDREIASCLPDYYRWTQWFFRFLYENDLAYRRKAPVNWCTSCNTVLANEQVVDGCCERCKNEVIQKNLEQWFFRVTEFIEDQKGVTGLINGLDTIDWPNSTKVSQRNWIGKQEGIDISYDVVDSDVQVKTFTKFPETNFGATFIVIAPEHEIVPSLITPEHRAEVEQYVQRTQAMTPLQRKENKEKTGVFTGSYAYNPLTKQNMPIYLADFVLAGYGTGMVVGVPAHDERDFEFAQQFGLDIVRVIKSYDGDESPVTSLDQVIEDGIMMNSELLDGLDAQKEAKEKIMDHMEEIGMGKRVTFYNLRDWLISRQRYWGAPIPVVYDNEGAEYLLPDDELPVHLPHDVDFMPQGESPLVGSKEFHHADDLKRIEDKLKAAGTLPAERTIVRRESDTMDTFMCSSWYMWRFMDPKNEQEFCSKKLANYWGPIDLYVGGAEHTVLHLLYSRFFCKVLCKYGYINYDEPFAKLRHQGMILAEDGRKMSKSLGNVVNPDDVVQQYGADTLRCYEMFMGPFDQRKPWSMASVAGVRKFLDKVWKAFAMSNEQGAMNNENTNASLERLLHQTVKKVSDDIEEMKFNTAISQMMILTNQLLKEDSVSQSVLETFTLLLSPFAPHMAEELWEQLGHTQTLAYEPWPTYDPALLVSDTVTYAVQVNGKVRADFEMSKEAGKEEVLQQARSIENVAKYLSEGEVVKEIFVPGKIVGFVVK